MTVASKYNLSASDGVAQAGVSPAFALGTEMELKGTRYKYLKSGAAITQYAACSVSNANVAVMGTTTTSGAKPTQWCVPQFAVAAADEYFWAPIGPIAPTAFDGSTAFKVLAAADCATSVKLYTTATDGVVDDSATDLIAGLCLTETITTARAATCISVGRMLSNCQD
jgi:hypothetical protein